MHWTAALILVSVIVTRVQSDHEPDHGKYGYVVRALLNIPCIKNPINDICPVDTNVPDVRRGDQGYINRTSIGMSLNSTSTALRSAGGNETCTDAAALYQCSTVLYTCNNDSNYAFLNSSEAYSLCMTARKMCAGVNETLLNLDSVLNCTRHKVETNPKFLRRETCMEYHTAGKNTCPTTNYEVPSSVDSTMVAKYYNGTQMHLKGNNVTKNCTNAILEIVCQVFKPACSKDEKYEVSLLSMEECMMGNINCLTNNTKLHKQATAELCVKLPHKKTAKKIPIEDIINIVTTPKQPITTKAVVTPSPSGCRAPGLSAITHILMAFIFCLSLGSFA